MSDKKSSVQEFYRIRVIIRIPGSQSLLLEGTYLTQPDDETLTSKKIKQECLDHVERNINWDKVPAPRAVCKMEVTYKALDNDFIVVGGKLKTEATETRRKAQNQ
jgi:hypothetical protein